MIAAERRDRMSSNPQAIVCTSTIIALVVITLAPRLPLLISQSQSIFRDRYVSPSIQDCFYIDTFIKHYILCLWNYISGNDRLMHLSLNIVCAYNNLTLHE